MIFGYMRTSKDTQDLSLQEDALKAYGVDKIYSEQISGVKERQELDKLISVLREGDTLVVWKIDRLGRTTSELVTLIDSFDKNKINFVSITENFDTKTPIGKFVLTLICAMASMEREILITRTRAGLEAARKRGRNGGRPKVPERKVKQVLALYKSPDYTVKEICEMVEISKSTFYRIVNNKYKGDIDNGK